VRRSALGIGDHVLCRCQWREYRRIP
jgi:hypothetical protein